MKSKLILFVLYTVVLLFHQVLGESSSTHSVKKMLKLKRSAGNHETTLHPAEIYDVPAPPIQKPGNYQQLKPHYPAPPLEDYEHKNPVAPAEVQHYPSYVSPYFSPYNEPMTGSPSSGLNTYYTDAGHTSNANLNGQNPYITEGHKKAGSLYLLEVDHSVNNDYATHDFCAEACRFRAIGGSRNIHMGLSPLGTESDGSCVCTCPVPSKIQSQIHPKLCSSEYQSTPANSRAYSLPYEDVEEYHGDEDLTGYYTEEPDEYSRRRRRRRNHAHPAVEEGGKVYPHVVEPPARPYEEDVEEYQQHPVPAFDEEYHYLGEHFNYEDEYFDTHCDEYCQGRAEQKPTDILGQKTAYFSGSCVSGQCVCACGVYSKPFENENFEHDYLPYHHP